MNVCQSFMYNLYHHLQLLVSVNIRTMLEYNHKCSRVKEQVMVNFCWRINLFLDDPFRFVNNKHKSTNLNIWSETGDWLCLIRGYVHWMQCFLCWYLLSYFKQIKWKAVSDWRVMLSIYMYKNRKWEFYWKWLIFCE
jgi:hypothetical protein